MRCVSPCRHLLLVFAACLCCHRRLLPHRPALSRSNAASCPSCLPFGQLRVVVVSSEAFHKPEKVGSVLLDVSPLFTSTKVLSGWMPVYHRHGLRGELFISVSLELLGDLNPYRDSSAGVRFYSRSSAPPGTYLKVIGFVEEIFDGDTPLRLRDIFKSSGAFDEAGIMSIAGQVQRLIGQKVIRLVRCSWCLVLRLAVGLGVPSC